MLGDFGDSATASNDDHDDVTYKSGSTSATTFCLVRSFQARLKRRNFFAAVVVHAGIGISRRAVWKLQILVAMQIEVRQLGQTRELFWDAAWRATPIVKPQKKSAQYGC